MAEKTSTATKTAHEPGPRGAQREPSAPAAPGLASALLAAQHGVGNRGVGRLLGGALLQSKLRIGPPDDAYEREADRVADELVGAAAPEAGVGAPAAVSGVSGVSAVSAVLGAGVQRMCKECQEEQEEEELHRQPAGAGGAVLQRACSCQEKDDEELVQTKAAGAKEGAGALLQRACSCQKGTDEELVQPKAAGATARGGGGLEEKVAALRGAGRPLPRDLRGFFEPRFGHDFGAVRVHTGPAAGEAANAAGARAFTVGNDVVFGAGEWSPGSAAGRHLLAHELTHVVQQTPLVARRKPLPRNQPRSQRSGPGEAAGASTRGAAREASAEAEPADVTPQEPALPPEAAAPAEVDLPAAPPGEAGPPATPPADAPPPAAPPGGADPPASAPTDDERAASSPPQAEPPGPRAAAPAREEPGATAPEAPEAAVTPSALVVEDAAGEIGRGQMTKSEFLALLRAEVSAAADAGLAGTEHSSRGCPFIDFWFRYYGRQNAGRIDRDLPRFVPAGQRPATAREYIPIIAARVRAGVEAWARTGEITGLPAGIPLPGMNLPGLTGGRAAGPLGRVLFKARAGAPRDPGDPRAIRDQLGPGGPLEGGLRGRMESAFGRSFSHVRVHADPNAAGLSSRLNARAFTVGDHVAFGAGEYRPGTLEGDALLAHELAHVAQQGDGDRAAAPAAGGLAEDRLEADADRSATAVLGSLWARVRGGRERPDAAPRMRSGLRLSRCTPRLRKRTVRGPNKGDCGIFDWTVQWYLNNKTGKGGWIVQHLHTTFDVKDCKGKAIDVKKHTGGRIDPAVWNYWEAWQVNKDKDVTTYAEGGDVYDDTYSIAQTFDKAKGKIVYTGEAEFYDGLTLPKTFKTRPKHPAGILPVATSAPTLKGGTGAIAHNITATWDCCPKSKSKKTETHPT